MVSAFLIIIVNLLIETLTLLVPMCMLVPNTRRDGMKKNIFLFVGIIIMLAIVFFVHLYLYKPFYLQYIVIAIALLLLSFVVCEKERTLVKFIYSILFTGTDMLCAYVIGEVICKSEIITKPMDRLVFAREMMGEIILERSLHIILVLGLVYLIKRILAKLLNSTIMSINQTKH